jgi:ATP-binding cassette subfamily B protein
MHTFLEVLKLGRDRLRGFILVAVLVSLGTGAALLEPWIYRAIIDDVAGVFVTDPSRVGELPTITDLPRTLPKSGQHLFREHRKARPQPAAPRRLKPKTVHEAAATLVIGVLILILARLVAELCRVAGNNRASVLANGVERSFILRTFGHVLRLPLTFFSGRASGAISRQIDQSDQIAPVFTAAAEEIWPDLFSLAAILVVLLLVNVELGLIVVIAVPVYAAVTWRMTLRLETNMDEYYALWDEVSSDIQQSVAGIKTIQTYDLADHEGRRMEESTGKAYDAYLRRNRIQNRFAYFQEIVVTLSKAGVLLLGGWKALEHQLSPGDVVMFIAYLDHVYGPIENLTGLYSSLQQHIGAIRRAEKLLAEPAAPGAEKARLERRGGRIEFEDVWFGYDPDRPVLKGVNLTVAAGEHVALVGPSGAGKTTLTDLLVGLYEPQRGEIRIDGQSVRDVSPASLRAAIRGVSPEGMIFRLSIRDNIRYGRLSASDAEVDEAARLAGLGAVLANLPERIDTVIGERGVELSMGERQRVLLARAFLAGPEVLILDEATASLDFRTENAVKDALRAISRGRTTLLVAHRRSMLTEVDRVLVLSHGRIEEEGTPAALVAAGGYFHQMMQPAS